MPNRKFNRKSQAQMKQQLAKQNAKATQQSPATRTPAPPAPPPPAQQPQRRGHWSRNKKTKMPPREKRPVEEAPAQTSFSYQANRDWRVLRNRLHPEGTTIEMMYTGEECLPPAEEPEVHQQQQQPKPRWPRVEARPGITHANVHLPQGVLPTTNALPDMPSYINAIDFFAHPERHQPDPSAGPRTTVTVTPKALGSNGQQPKAASIMEVVPLGTYQGAPLEPGSLNMAFQSFSTMDFTLEPPEEGSDPTCTSYSAEMSPSIMLTPHQQHRLQAAVLQQEVPLVEALLPVVQDIRKEYAQMRDLGQQPASHPIPHTTMQIFSKNPYNLPASSQSQVAGAPGGGLRSGPGSVSGSQTGPGTGSRLVLLPTPQMAPMQPNYSQPPPRYPVFVQPNFVPNYGQAQPPRYPVFVQPNLMPGSASQPPPRYPVYVHPNFIPNYSQQGPQRYPVFLQPNYSQPPPPQGHGRRSSHRM